MLYEVITNFSYKADFLNLTGKHKLKYGTELSYNAAVPHFIRNDSILPIEINDERNNINSTQATLFFRDEYSFCKWQINAGLRLNLYAHIGPYTDFDDNGDVAYAKNKIVKTYWGLEPRFYSRYLLNSESSLKFAATRHIQYINQIPVFSFGVRITSYNVCYTKLLRIGNSVQKRIRFSLQISLIRLMDFIHPKKNK